MNQQPKNSRRQTRTVASPDVARLLAAPRVPDNGDAYEHGRTRAAALAWWLSQNQAQPAHAIGAQLLAVFAEMNSAPAPVRHAFLTHIGHLVAVGSQHFDVADDLAQQNSAAVNDLTGVKW